MRTDTQITLTEVCEAWRHEKKAAANSHLPTSALFDLMQHSLDGDEQSEAMLHLAECPVCLQDLKEMVRITSSTLPGKQPLAAAADSPVVAPLVPTASSPDQLLVGQEP